MLLLLFVSVTAQRQWQQAEGRLRRGRFVEESYIQDNQEHDLDAEGGFVEVYYNHDNQEHDLDEDERRFNIQDGNQEHGLEIDDDLEEDEDDEDEVEPFWTSRALMSMSMELKSKGGGKKRTVGTVGKKRTKNTGRGNVGKGRRGRRGRRGRNRGKGNKAEEAAPAMDIDISFTTEEEEEALPTEVDVSFTEETDVVIGCTEEALRGIVSKCKKQLTNVYRIFLGSHGMPFFCLIFSGSSSTF